VQISRLVLIRIVSHETPERVSGPNAGDVGPPPPDNVEGLVLGLQPVHPPESRFLPYPQAAARSGSLLAIGWWQSQDPSGLGGYSW